MSRPDPYLQGESSDRTVEDELERRLWIWTGIGLVMGPLLALLSAIVAVGIDILGFIVAFPVGIACGCLSIIVLPILRRRPLALSAVLVYLPTTVSVIYVTETRDSLIAAGVSLIVLYVAAILTRLIIRPTVPKPGCGNYCVQCGYDLSGLREPGCPECGAGRRDGSEDERAWNPGNL